MAIKRSVAAPTHAVIIDDKFSTAPVEWRVGGAGVLEVANRWQCDPRWTFCSLSNDRRIGKPAVLWSKRTFPGDVSVEFFFGIKMDHMRGNPYSYARDVHLTIGSDGSDLTKGVTFSFGGQNNTCSSISRDGVDLKRLAIRIPTQMDYANHWYHFRAERLYGKLIFQVDHFFQGDDRKLGEWIIDDPRPLSGDRLAIWTYDDAIILSRVRLSGESSGTESPDFLPGKVVTVYDK